jgi:hypothetical protein
MKFIPVVADKFPNLREGRRGRVSYPLLKSFLETNMSIAQLDRTGMQQSLQSLNSSLGAYIRGHGLPIKIANRGGEIYLIRIDVDEKGNVLPAKTLEEYRAATLIPATPAANVVVTPITPAEVKTRFAQEKGKVGK